MSNFRVKTITPEIINNPNSTINLLGSLTVNTFTSTNTTDASSISAASIILSGGVAIAKNIQMGGNILFNPAVNYSIIGNNTSLNSDNKGLILSSTGVNDASRGTSLLLNGIGLNNGDSVLNIASGATFSIYSSSNLSTLFNPSGSVNFYNNTASSNSTTASVVFSGGISIANTTDSVSSVNGGSMTIAGGLAVSKKVFMGTSLTVTNNTTTNTLNVLSTTNSTSVTSGSLVTSGGFGVEKDVWIGGSQFISGDINTQSTLSVNSSSATAITTNGGMSIGSILQLGGDLTSTGSISLTGILRNTNTTESTTTTNGSVVLSGGLAVAKNVNIGGSLYSASLDTNRITSTGINTVENTTDCTTIGVGSLIISGGVSIAKTTRIGANLFVTGTTNFSGNTVASNMTVDILNITNTTDTLSVTTGSLITAGGLAVAKSIITGGTVSIKNTSNSNSINSGALIVSGGMAVSKNIYIGDSVVIVNSLTATDISVNNTDISGYLNIQDSTDSSSVITGSVTTLGGVGIAKNAHIGGNLVILGESNFMDNSVYSGIINSNNLLDSTSLSVASVVISGGVSIAKKIRIGSDTNIDGNANINGTIICSNTTESVSSHTGAFTISGGIGIGQSIFADGSLNISGITNLNSNVTVYGLTTFSNTTDAISTSNGSVIVVGGLAIMKSICIGNNLNVSGTSNLVDTNISGMLNITNTTNSSSTSTGSLVIAGGIAISKNIYCDGNFHITGTSQFSNTVNLTNITDSSSSTTGALTLSGGLGLLRNLNVGGNIVVSGTSTFTGNLTNTSGIFTFGNISLVDLSGIFYISSSVPGLRLAGDNSIKSNVYSNSFELFSLGNSFVDSNYEVLQFTTTSTDAFSIMSRNLGTGAPRKIVLQSGTTNTGQIILNTNGTVFFSNTTNSTSVSNGSVQISGGLSVSKNFSLGSKLVIFGSTSGYISFTPSSTTSSYDLVLPSALPLTSSALVTDSLGNLSWSQMLDADPTFNTVTIIDTTDATNSTTGSLQISGGVGISKNLFVGGRKLILGNDGGSGGSPNMIGFTGVSGDINTTSIVERLYSGSDNSELLLFKGAEATDTVRIISSEFYIDIPSSFPSSYNFISDTVSSCSRQLTISLNSAKFSGKLILNNGSDDLNNRDLINVYSNYSGSRSMVWGHDYTINDLLEIGFDFTDSGSLNNFGYINLFGNPGLKIYPNSIHIDSTTNSVSLNSGALIVSGGISVSKNLSLGSNLIIYGDTSGYVSFKSSSTTTSYTLQLPANLPSTNNYALVSSTTGVLSWSQMITTNPTFETIIVSSTTDSTDINTGSVIIEGGAAIGKNLTIGDTLQIAGSSSGIISIMSPSINNNPTFTLPSDLPNSNGLYLTGDTNGNLNWTALSQNIVYTFNASNNVSSPATVTNLVLSSMAKIDVLVNITTTGQNYSAKYTLHVYPDTDNNLLLFQDYWGDNTGITFFINSGTGQITYTSIFLNNWSSSLFKWSAPDLYTTPTGGFPQSFYASNNVTTPTDVNGLLMNQPQFSIYILVTINSTNSLASLFLLEGVYQPTGTWSLTPTEKGPISGVSFTITSSGQIQYTSDNISGWLSTIFQFYPDAAELLTSATLNNLTILGTTDSTSTTTGAISLYGGLGVQKSLNVGTGLYVNNLSNNIITLNGSGTQSMIKYNTNNQSTNYFICGTQWTGSQYNFAINNQSGNGVFLVDNNTNWTSTSDRRLKTEINEITPEEALDIVDKLKPVSYKWKNGETHNTHLGLIAQDVQTLIPNIVHKIGNGENNEELLGISYTELIPLLISAIQCLKNKIQSHI